MRLSEPIPFRIFSMFAPLRSQRFAISFMKLIFIAKKPLAAYFTSSDERASIAKIGLPLRTNGS